MPRRNIHILLFLTFFGLLCSAKVSRLGRDLVFAMDQIEMLALERTTRQDLFEGALEGMMGRLDDFSEYISPEQITRFEQTLNQQFGGVGIEILLDPETKQLVVTSPLQGSPALAAGIRPGDKILRIDGKSTQGLSIEDAGERMRGAPGEAVRVTVLHPGETEPVELEIVRDVIQVDTVLGDTRNADGSWEYFLEGAERIGYLRVNSFTPRTDEELKQAIDGLVARDLKGLILDLRNNPGGSLDSAINMCDMFIEPSGDDPGEIVSTRGRDGKTLVVYYAKENSSYAPFPMAVLVNQYSASASEIVAACLQDHGRAVVVGQRSYGKGTIQQILGLEPGLGELKLTTASYWRPSGKNIHRRRDATEADAWGVSPDPGYEVKLDDTLMAELLRWRQMRDGYRPAGQQNPAADDYHRDAQLTRAVEYVTGTAKQPPK